MADKVKTVRLRNIHSGAVVSVPEEKAARMRGEWESADKPAPTVKKATAKRAAKKAARSSVDAATSDD